LGHKCSNTRDVKSPAAVRDGNGAIFKLVRASDHILIASIKITSYFKRFTSYPVDTHKRPHTPLKTYRLATLSIPWSLYHALGRQHAGNTVWPVQLNWTACLCLTTFNYINGLLRQPIIRLTCAPAVYQAKVFQQQFLARDAMQKRDLCRRAVGLSVRLSRACILSKRINVAYIFKFFFHYRVATPFHSFSIPNVIWQESSQNWSTPTFIQRKSH